MPKDRHSGRAVGSRLCAYTPSGDPADDCGRLATWHVLWDASFKSSLACDEHMGLVTMRWVYDDRHVAGSDCNMPGALWRFDLKKCEVPGFGSSGFLAVVTEMECAA
jgi:hypothetical protein